MAYGKLERLLVVEDDSKYLADAKRIFENLKDLEVFYAENGAQVRKLLGVYNFGSLEGLQDVVDGVIIDLFFSLGPNEFKEEVNSGPNGLIVGAFLRRAKIPYVLCTSGYHHGSKYEWANQMNIAMGDAPLIDYTPLPGASYEEESSHKNWYEVYRVLKQKCKEREEISVYLSQDPFAVLF